jgi:fatty acid desaturase
MTDPTISELLGKEARSCYAVTRKTWSIRQNQIIFDMVTPWFFIALSFLIFWKIDGNVMLSCFFSIIAPLYISFWKNAFTLFFHEAAHNNLTKDKKLNDLISNVFLTPFMGFWVKEYRVHHWEHHKNFGEDGDTETSYMAPLSFKGVIEALTGIYLIKTAMRYFIFPVGKMTIAL